MGKGYVRKIRQHTLFLLAQNTPEGLLTQPQKKRSGSFAAMGDLAGHHVVGEKTFRAEAGGGAAW